ncbi:DUF4340 domain-containing protein [Flavonifractor sp. An100]|uniref:DUF4340 domain-containing protein n=1 Tax=Flavonifractor sp. An100 TaxID=1965538 RepID=UPI000B365AA8|nr:DUF4340 domain-containing protein [Flavonifractor sp. An100]OUQ75233.1 hypothetical protein B5E43_14035 [Flavonifractor sp. An100]
MKRAKRLYCLLAILAVVCVATFFVVRHQEKQEEIRNSGETVLALSSDAVQSLSWTYEDQSLAFHKEDSWLYDEDSEFPVDQEKVEELLGLFEDFTAAFIIKDVTDYAQYGLDDPTCTIQLAAGEQSYEITLGNYSTMDSQRYVSLGDGNVYLVNTDPMDYFEISLSDMIQHDETPEFDTVEEIQLSGNESYEIVYQEYTEDSPYTYCSDDVYFKKEGDDLLPLDTSLVDDYLSSITNLTLTDYKTYRATDEDLATYGLDDPELTITVTYTPETEEDAQAEAETFTLSISRDPEERQAPQEETDSSSDAAEEEEEDIVAYVRVDQSGIIYQISGSSYTTLMAAGYDDLRHHEVFPADSSILTGMDVVLDGESYSITSQGSGEDQVFYYNEEELDLTNLLSALEALSAERFTGKTPTQAEELDLTLYLDNQVHSQVHIQLYRYDGESCLAVIDEVPVSLVPRSDVVDLVEAIHAIVL